MSHVQIGNHTTGVNQPIFIIAEIGINHNGRLDSALDLIKAAVEAGADAVKFQKRTVDVVYTPEELSTARTGHPFGDTNGDLKHGLEFGEKEYRAIDERCKELGILWLASPWDEGSVDFLEQFNPPCYKIASASLTDDELLKHLRKTGRPIILSTGMSDLPMIEHAVEILGEENLIILHCTSVYVNNSLEPGDHGLGAMNLRGIETLKKRYPDVPIGFSSNDTGIQPTYAAAVMGACVIEKHLTLYKGMWGSDQGMSNDPEEFRKLCRMIRELELAFGDGDIVVYPQEVPVAKKLRRNWGIWPQPS